MIIIYREIIIIKRTWKKIHCRSFRNSVTRFLKGLKKKEQRVFTVMIRKKKKKKGGGGGILQEKKNKPFPTLEHHRTWLTFLRKKRWLTRRWMETREEGKGKNSLDYILLRLVYFNEKLRDKLEIRDRNPFSGIGLTNWKFRTLFDAFASIDSHVSFSLRRELMRWEVQWIHTWNK